MVFNIHIRDDDVLICINIFSMLLRAAGETAASVQQVEQRFLCCEAFPLCKLGRRTAGPESHISCKIIIIIII